MAESYKNHLLKKLQNNHINTSIRRNNSIGKPLNTNLGKPQNTYLVKSQNTHISTIDKNTIYYILIGVFLILFVFLLYIIMIKVSPFFHTKGKEYDIQLPNKYNSEKSRNLCPVGCVRGRCNTSLPNSKCKTDNDCDYCQDTETKMFYVNGTSVLEKDMKKGNLTNSDIKKYDTYIDQLNRKIIAMNS